MSNTLQWNGPALADEVRRRSGAAAGACMQCHKCSTGCPIGPDMDLLPSQVMRLVQLGAEEEVLSSQAIWLCASCEACTARCPMGIDIAAVMDTLRMRAIDRAATVPDARNKKFNSTFLGSVRRHGRVFEAGMLAVYKLLSGDWFADVGKVPEMLAKGKLRFFPRRSGAAAKVKDVFKRAQEEERKR